MATIRNIRISACRLVAAVTMTGLLAGCCGSNDDVCGAQQNAMLAGVIANGGYQPYRAARPVFVSCTRVGNVVNCLGQ